MVRTKDKAETIEQALLSLREQTIRPHIIVIDSGSTDATLTIAERFADDVIEIPPEAFSYGGTLNLGTEKTDADIVFALSAHCVAQSNDWVERSLAYYVDDAVAGTNGSLTNPSGEWLVDPWWQTLADTQRNPYWGYSNHAGSWRREIWDEFRFREDLDSCEDKEWSWRVLKANYTLVYDPALYIESTHRRKAGLRSLYERVNRESATLTRIGDLEPTSLPSMCSVWLHQPPHVSRRYSSLRWINPFRLVEMAARYTGEHRGARLRTPEPL